MPGAAFEHDRILVVDDEQLNIDLLEIVLETGGYSRVRTSRDPRQILSLYREFEPDLLLLDLHMPYLDGFQVMRQLQPRIPADTYFPILILTGDPDPRARQDALALGAKDFLTKPFDRIEVLLRIRNLLETRALHRQLQMHNQELNRMVKQRTRELTETQYEILQRLAIASEYRDDLTGQHAQRVGVVSAMLAEAAGLPADRVELIRQAAPLHDVGKIGIPDHILMKPAKLTPEEYEQIKTHTVIGARILSGSSSPLLQMAEEIALYHHERWDGTGYASLAGESIPIEARIVTIADVFDVMTHDRPYKTAQSIAEARAEIERGRGRQFDPALAEAFLRLTQTEDLVSLGRWLEGRPTAWADPSKPDTPGGKEPPVDSETSAAEAAGKVGGGTAR